MADDDAVIVRELEGELRSVVLYGPNLPEQLVAAVDLRSVQTRYPGNSRASTQILGSKEDDITLDGQFRDVWSGADGDAVARVTTLRAIVLAGRWCELSWGETVVRRGFLKRVEPTFRRAGIVAYKLVFQVDQADEASAITPISFPVAPEGNLAAVMARIEARRAVLEGAIGLWNVLSGVLS